MIAEQADGAHRLLTSWRSGSWHGPGGRGARQLGVMPRIALGPRASQVQPGLDEPERPEDDHVEPVLVRDEPLDRADLGAGEDLRHGRHLLAAQPAARVQTATRTCGLRRTRLTLPEAASVSTRSLPSRWTNHTGVATPRPSRL